MKIFLIHIVFSLLAFHTFCQKPVVWLEIEPKEAEIGEVLTITVKSNVQGEIEIDLPSGFVHGYNIVNAMDQEMDYNTGKVITYYYFSQTGAMPKAGAFKFGPAYVKKGNKVYRSNTINVVIKKENVTTSSSDKLTAKQLSQPAFGIIEKSKSIIYEGEPVVLNAKVYSQFNASHLENYQAYSLNNVLDKHEIGNTTRIVVEEEKINRTSYYTFEYDKQVVFPIGTGKMSIDPYKLILRRGMESLPLTSGGATIEVKPLPGNVPAQFIGGVGQFSISRTVQSGKLKQGDVFNMIVEIVGFGNLQNIMEPKLNLPKGFLIYGDPIVKEDFVYGQRGAEGKITYEYNIQVTKFGKLTIPETTISYFDPTKEKYLSVSSGTDILDVEKNIKFKANTNDPSLKVQTAIDEEIFPLRRDEGNKNAQDLIYNSPKFWMGVSAPLFIGFIFGFLWKKKEEQAVVGEQKQAKRRSHLEIQDLFKEADSALKQGDFSTYYNMIEKGIQRSMSLYLKNDDAIILSKTEIFRILEEQQIDPSKLSALHTLFSTCEHARYGLGISNEDRDNLIVSAKKVTQSIIQA